MTQLSKTQKAPGTACDLGALEVFLKSVFLDETKTETFFLESLSGSFTTYGVTDPEQSLRLQRILHPITETLRLLPMCVRTMPNRVCLTCTTSFPKCK